METTTINGTPQQIDFPSIPRELQSLDQWLLWKTVTRDGKAKKIPLSVYNTAASSTNPKTWTSFDNAVSTYDPSQHGGIGFVFTSSDHFCCIDLVGCRDPETGVVADWAINMVERFASYTEISPSQTGLRILITADSSLPKGKAKELRVPEIVAKTPAIEIYTQGRYSAVTGHFYQQYRHIEHRESELQAFLKEHWPSVLIRWRDEFVSTRTKQSYADLVRDLLSLSGETDATGFEKPALLDLSADSRKLFAEYMNDTGEQCFVMFGDVRAAWAKFIGRCARLAGIIHCCRQADGDIKEPWTIDTDSMQAAIALCEWSKAETLRVYELLKEDAYTNSLRLLAAWIKHHGGSVTARDLSKHKRDIESSDDAEQWLRNLQDAGFGTYEVQAVGPTGGRPTAKFILKSESL